MNPNQQPTLPNPTQPFTQQHNQIYEQLRQALMQLHQQGVPGIDKILGTLNQQHINLAKQASQLGRAPIQNVPRNFGSPAFGDINGQFNNVMAQGNRVLQNTPPAVNQQPMPTLPAKFDSPGEAMWYAKQGGTAVPNTYGPAY